MLRHLVNQKLNNSDSNNKNDSRSNSDKEDDEEDEYFTSREKKKKNTFVGTAEYVSPEVLIGDEIGPECDLWALGCMIYRFLAGQTAVVVTGTIRPHSSTPPRGPRAESPSRSGPP